MTVHSRHVLRLEAPAVYKKTTLLQENTPSETSSLGVILKRRSHTMEHISRATFAQSAIMTLRYHRRARTAQLIHT